MFQLLKAIGQSQEDVLEELDESQPSTAARRQEVDPPQITEQFRNGLVYASLREGLRERMPPLEPAGYGFLRTLGEKMELSGAEIEKTQTAYAQNIRRYSTYASQEDEIHGWRRVAIIGPGIRAPAPGSYHQGDGEYRVFLVDHDGRLSSRSLPANGENNLSVAEILDRALEDDLFALAAGKFNLNPFSYNFRNTARGAGQTLCEDVSQHLFNRKNIVQLESSNGPFEEVHFAEEEEPRDDGMSKKYQFTHILTSLNTKRLEASLRNVAASIRNALDPDMLKIMRSTHLMETSNAEWLSGTIGERDTSIARIQACRSYPVLAKHFSDDPVLTDAIDQRKPLAPIIADHLKIGESGVRNLTGLTWQRIGQGAEVNLMKIQTIGSIPRDFTPKNKVEFSGLQSAVKFSEMAHLSLDEVIEKFAEGGSPWRHAAAFEKTPLSDVDDFASYMSQRLYVPAILRRIRDTHPDETFGRISEPHFYRGGNAFHRDKYPNVAFIQSLKVKDLLNGSDRWHRSLQRHEDRISTIDRRNVWRPLLDEATATALSARELDSSQKLKTQGAMESHCVGGYDSAVMRSNPKSATVIYSIEKNDKILGTLELGMRQCKPRKVDGQEVEPVTIGDGMNIRIAQHRAKSNSEPSATAKRLADGLISHIKDMPMADLQNWIEDIQEVRKKAVSANKLPLNIRNAGYNIWDDAQFQAAWDELSVYLPRKTRKAGLEAFVESMDALTPDLQVSAAHLNENPFWEEGNRKAAAVIAGEVEDDEPLPISRHAPELREIDHDDPIPF